MTKGKIITYWVVLVLTMISVLYSYTITGVNVSSNKAYLLSMVTPFVLLVILMLCFLLTTLSNVVPRALSKKNLLRVTLFIEVILFVVFLAITIKTFMNGWACISCIITVVLTFILIIITIAMMKELYLLIQDLINK